MARRFVQTKSRASVHSSISVLVGFTCRSIADTPNRDARNANAPSGALAVLSKTRIAGAVQITFMTRRTTSTTTTNPVKPLGP